MEVCEARFNSFVGKHGVRCLFACYTGSIATGLQSGESDLDIRFVYVRPMESYFCIDGTLYTDSVGEINETLDVEGWELRKFLSMLHQSNVRAFEMLSSPALPAQCDALMTHALSELVRECFCAKRVMFFYLSDARRHMRRFLTADKEQVLQKKYFFVVKPLLSILWIRTHGANAAMPPMQWDALFEQMRDALPAAVVQELQTLTANKRAGAYSGTQAAALWPHLVHVEMWYGPLLANDSPLEHEISALPDVDNERKTALRERMDALLFATLTRVNGWTRK